MKRISRFALIIISIVLFSGILGYGVSYFFPMPLYQYNETVNITCLGCHDITYDDYSIPFIMTILIPVLIFVACLFRYIPVKQTDKTP